MTNKPCELKALCNIIASCGNKFKNRLTSGVTRTPYALLMKWHTITATLEICMAGPSQFKDVLQNAPISLIRIYSGEIQINVHKRS